MAAFLRDERVSNVKIDEDALAQINDVFTARLGTLPPDNQPAPGFLYYIIRFDNKGYQVHTFELLMSYFRNAKYVERVIFTLVSARAIETNRNVGSYFELRLDHNEPNTCIVQVASDDSGWVDAAFSGLAETLSKFRNKHGWARSRWTEFIIQITGIFLGFFVSLLGAAQLAPNLAIENAFLISFFFFLLVFSNSWGFINHQLNRLANYAFPNIKFDRPSKDGIHWLIQTLVGGIVAAVAVFVINELLSYMGRVIGQFASGNG